jgi:opacity protein-like surface antigen
MCLGISPLMADDNSFNVNGFGTIGGIYNTNNDYLFRPDLKRLSGSDGTIDFKGDSLLGLQMDSKIAETLSGSVQTVFWAGDENDPLKHETISAAVEWAFLKWTPNDAWNIHLGRLRLPAYGYSESYNVGFSYPWIRTPMEIYAQVPFSSYDGMSLSYNGVYDDYFYKVQIPYGKSNLKLKIDATTRLNMTFENMWGVVLSGGTQFVQLRANYIQGTMNPSLDPTLPLMNALIGSGFSSVANDFKLDGKIGHYMGFGATINYELWEIIGEYSHKTMDSFFGDFDSLFLHVGYQWDKLKPYVTYSQTTQGSSKTSRNPLDTTNPFYDSLQAIIDGQNLEQRTWTLGVRYDVTDNMALKIQYETIDMATPNGGFAVGISPNRDGKINVISAALQYVF